MVSVNSKEASSYFYSKQVVLVIQVTLNVFDGTPSKAFRLQKCEDQNFVCERLL